jgi:hypothetical protein
MDQAGDINGKFDPDENDIRGRDKAISKANKNNNRALIIRFHHFFLGTTLSPVV